MNKRLRSRRLSTDELRKKIWLEFANTALHSATRMHPGLQGKSLDDMVLWQEQDPFRPQLAAVCAELADELTEQYLRRFAVINQPPAPADAADAPPSERRTAPSASSPPPGSIAASLHGEVRPYGSPSRAQAPEQPGRTAASRPERTERRSEEHLPPELLEDVPWPTEPPVFGRR
jgi:hypothetical protein